MSLINDMLKDLEKREATVRNVPNIALINAIDTYDDANIQRKIFFASLSLAMVIIVLAIAYISYQPTKTSTYAQPVIEKNNSPLPLAKNDNAHWLDPVTITGVALQVKENITEIIFSLDHQALYQLSTNEMLNQLSVTLHNATLQSELPTINNLNTGIHRIATQTADGMTKFSIIMMPGAMLKYVNLTSDAKHPELVVAIEYLPTTPEAKESQSANAIKTPAMNTILSQQYQSALTAAEGGQYQVAIDTLSQLIKIDPSYTVARGSLAALLIDQGRQLSKATRIIDEGLALNPDYLPFIELKARIMTIEGKIKPALVLLQSMSPSIEDNPEYHAFIAALQQRSNNNLLASSIYKKLVLVNPNNGGWWLGLGVSLERLGERKQARDAYTKAMTEGHLSAESLSYLQSRLRVLGEDNNAKE